MSYWNGTQWAPEQPDPRKRASRGRRLVGASLEASLVVLLVFGLIASTAFAAKGGNGGGKGAGKPGAGGESSSTLAISMVVDQNGDGVPNWNDQVTFEVSTSATDKPWVRLDCYQAGTWVSTTTHGFFSDYPWPATFTLASGGWTGGDGDCTATLYAVGSNGKARDLAAMSFHVGA